MSWRQRQKMRKQMGQVGLTRDWDSEVRSSWIRDCAGWGRSGLGRRWSPALAADIAGRFLSVQSYEASIQIRFSFVSSSPLLFFIRWKSWILWRCCCRNLDWRGSMGVKRQRCWLWNGNDTPAPHISRSKRKANNFRNYFLPLYRNHNKIKLKLCLRFFLSNTKGLYSIHIFSNFFKIKNFECT